MPRLSTRTTGIALTILGFSIAIVAGLILAAQVNTLGTGGLLIGGGLAFLVAGVPLFAGLYLYARSAAAAQELNTEMIQQRELMDILKAQPQTTLGQLATQLKIPETEVHNIVAGLGRLQVFIGYITPTGNIHRLEATILPALVQCQHCGAPLKVQDTITICSACGTEYYPPESPNKWGQISG